MTTLSVFSILKVSARPAATGRFAPSMLVLPKMPSSVTPLCSAESRPFDSPVVLREHLRHHHARLDALHQERRRDRGAAGR